MNIGGIGVLEVDSEVNDGTGLNRYAGMSYNFRTVIGDWSWTEVR